MEPGAGVRGAGPGHRAPHQLPRRLRQRAPTAGLLAEHAGRSSERVGADLDRPTVLDAPAAVEYGLVDHVVPSRRDAVG
ncbi:ATP-dependent Clp protease proteolytic subunit [Streptomyces sp. NPDC012825]|uniref:ATP-dependent Clp protease proteolytic subunit n=1 Tax=Streptomyces sp. NPDC012825 TaxID=3364851 RepID=UPI003686F21E